MKILVINPNTTEAVTDLAMGHIRTIAREAGANPETFTAVTGRFGARYISSRAAAAIAAHAALDAYAAYGEGCDAVYLACFGDPGLLALRELANVPVVGMAEAAMLNAITRGRRVAVVTGGALWKPMLTEFYATLGLSPHLAAIRAIALTGGQIAQDPDAALADLTRACLACAQQDRADVVILGGAALAGLAERIQPDVPIPLICSVAAGAHAALAAAGRPQQTAQPPVTETIGLSAELAALLARR